MLSKPLFSNKGKRSTKNDYDECDIELLLFEVIDSASKDLFILNIPPMYIFPLFGL